MLSHSEWWKLGTHTATPFKGLICLRVLLFLAWLRQPEYLMRLEMPLIIATKFRNCQPSTLARKVQLSFQHYFHHSKDDLLWMNYLILHLSDYKVKRPTFLDSSRGRIFLWMGVRGSFSFSISSSGAKVTACPAGKSIRNARLSFLIKSEVPKVIVSPRSIYS